MNETMTIHRKQVQAMIVEYGNLIMSTEITFEQWNCFPRILKKSVDERTLEAIESHPLDFTFFDDGTVRNYVNIAVIESTDYEP